MQWIDSHVHFDADILDAEGMLASMDENGIERAALIAPLTGQLDETALMHYGGGLLRSALAGRLRPLRRAVRGLYDRWSFRDGEIELGGRRYPVILQPDNGPIVALVRRHPERFLGWIFINPDGPVHPIDEIERCKETPGMFGVKTHAYWHGFAIESLRDVAALCVERDMPLLVHLGCRGGGDYTLLPRLFPGLKLVYAHAGVPYQRAVCAFARESENVYVDLSSPGYVSTRIARTALALAGPRKCMFGSDGPYFEVKDGRMNYAASRRLVEAAELSATDLEAVARGNFESLLGR